MRSTRPGRGAVVASLVAVGLLAAACGSSDDSSSDSGPVTLSVGVFGDSFTPAMYRAYESAHPGVKIKEVRADYATHHNNLQAHITAGAGAADVELIEIGQISGFLGQANSFVNFADQGVDLKQWTDAKMKQVTTPDGKSVLGLPTDTGGLAICYRTDLFAAAGLPTDREAVSKLFPTWEQYVATGKQFLAKAPKGVTWFDAAGNLFNGALGDESQTYYDAQGNVVAATNPAVKQAWDLSVSAIQAGESAKLAGFSAEWNTGFQRGQFATVTCPSWMLGYIRTNAPETKGTWDVATVPGGSGNWGGSFATVPTQGKHQKQAIELAKWLTDPAQALTRLPDAGQLPERGEHLDEPGGRRRQGRLLQRRAGRQDLPGSLENAPVRSTARSGGSSTPPSATR
jgi:cellobiose transport system substrate-binding protein